MKLKSLFWTGFIAVFVFFAVVYFGIKYNWVNEAKPKYTSSETAKQPKSPSLITPTSTDQKLTNQTGNGIKPELIDETPVIVEGQLLNSPELTIEEVVSQCHDIATSVGIPEQQFEQAVIECIDRNSDHLKHGNIEVDERAVRVREQCSLAITPQRDLLSEEEIKILTDECVASMQ